MQPCRFLSSWSGFWRIKRAGGPSFIRVIAVFDLAGFMFMQSNSESHQAVRWHGNCSLIRKNHVLNNKRTSIGK
ncbi:hypothetical protein BP00DRAFT_213639 [Aspergillus indologenus CBS 114.80]|uniref:Uncharacterized protein n=1 Tax=Aspergillus indologenus CBS 114.80 TaxID=1450541 RepID=A0A2V5I040_9EURO|nr:hypothetical protein BP00DRAFT_213639 [Aspergillus indologenus CBS 114.80]